MIKHLTLPKKMAAMVLLAGAALSIAPVQAASYPTKQIELVVPYAAGGGTDLVGWVGGCLYRRNAEGSASKKYHCSHFFR